ncbi:SGNH/GDSL hydrolase family protein [Olsenella uli]|uniref:SGNH/GDSL hydrolase family protein n=1 Tax=Olsenella uli TaxID=133926 RepID=UPI0012DE67F8|nr:SGNH/GDSL hydrolase family protein [Olsenella uli]
MRITRAKARVVGGSGRRGGLTPARLLGVMAWCALLVLVDVAATLALGQYGSLSAVAVDDFGSAPSVGTAFVGSSFAERAFDPMSFDDARQEEDVTAAQDSYNLSTPGQTMGATGDAVSYAIQRGARRVVLGLGVETMCCYADARSDVPYYLARYEREPLTLVGRLASVALDPDVVGSKDSLNVLFPWIFTTIKHVPSVGQNLRSRLSGEARSAAAEKVVRDWRYAGRGYGNFTMQLDLSDPRTSVNTYGEPRQDPRCLEALARIADECRSAGVQLVVVSTPHPAYDTAAFGDAYPEIMGAVQRVAQEHGATYLDFNMARDGVLDLSPEDYGDFEHLGPEGARRFSRLLAQMLSRIDEGADASSDFYGYDDWSQWLAGHQGWRV